MRFHYKGKYSGDPESLPGHEHEPGAVPYKEPQDMNELAGAAARIAIVLLVVMAAILILRGGTSVWWTAGAALYFATLVPHEFLHACCFRGDVYMYNDLRQGLLFVTSSDTMSKAGFIWMSLCPNIILGLVPFLIFLADPSHAALGMLGVLGIPSGAGDYLNVYNTITQVPAGARVYMNGIHTFWYMPERGDSN